MNMSTYVTRPIHKYGSEDQIERYVRPTLKGELFCGEAITEPLHGSDIAHLETRAEKKTDNYVVTGEKRFQKGGFGADWFLLFVRTDPDVKPQRGISALIVERKHGIKIEEQFNLMGWRGMGASHLLLKSVELPEKNLVGEEGQGFEILQYLLQGERILEGSAAIGSARSSLKLAGKYADERKQFGRKIGEFEGLGLPLAKMATKIDASKLLLLRAARTIDELDKRPNKDVSMAKYFATETAWEAIDQSLQILGGIGYTDYYPIERHLRDIRVSRIYTGTSEIQKEVVRRGFLKELRKSEPEFGWEEWKGSKILKKEWNQR